MNPREADAWAAVLADFVPEERELFGRFLSALFAVASVTALPLVRAERVEVVDGKGRPRVVIGALGRATAGTVGVGIYDRRASERITLALGEAGPILGFSLDGTGALLLGVDDFDTAAVDPGPYVEILTSEGDVAVGWRVHGDTGEVRLLTPVPRGPDADA
jgi:hypothetical protein